MFSETLDKFNKSLRFFPRNTYDIGWEREIVETSILSRVNYYKDGSDKCPKFGIAEDDPRDDGIFINYFLKNSVAGRTEAIAGHFTFLLIMRNVFMKGFSVEWRY